MNQRQTSKYLLSFLFSFCLSLSCIYSQESKEIKYDNLGLSFTIPEGWSGQEGESGFVLGSNSIPGFILITTNEIKSMEAMENEAKMGINDASGTSLQLNGTIDRINERAIGGEYVGVMEGQSAKAYVIGMLNSEGYGLTILGATTSDSYAEIHQESCIKLAKSVKFFKAILPDAVKQWKDALQNARLTYMDSYSSYDYSSDYTTGGGYSSKEEIDLCAAGYFNFSSNSSMSVDGGGASAYSNSDGSGSGTWDVISSASGEAILQLKYYDGTVSEYTLTDNEGETQLNGYRYFRTYGTVADDGPNCN